MPDLSAYSYDRVFNTPLGPIAVLADVYILDDTVELRELSFYPVGREHLDLGIRLVRSIYRQLEEELKSVGYKKIVITGHRTRGATPGRAVNIDRRLR